MSLVHHSSPHFTADAPVVVLWLHGFGSHEQDLPPLAPHVTGDLPWVSLRAPLTIAPGGYAWFEIVNPGNPDAARIAAATDELWGWIDQHLSAATRLLPIGFSQGGLMASQLLRTRPERLATTAILSGFVQAAPQPADAVLAQQRPPVFWGRGTEDRVITPEAIARTAEFLPGHSTLTEGIYPGLAHGIDATEAAELKLFIEQHVG